jgi:hypothetical protein
MSEANMALLAEGRSICRRDLYKHGPPGGGRVYLPPRSIHMARTIVDCIDFITLPHCYPRSTTAADSLLSSTGRGCNHAIILLRIRIDENR